MNPTSILPENSTLVLGAGVSNPYGFPLGPELVRLITQLDPIGFVKQTMTGKYSTIVVEQFQADLRASGWESIDRFLEHRPEYSDLGKSLIAYALMNLEDPERLYDSENGIYRYLYNHILNPTAADTLNNKRFIIITYNYDRSLEFYLWNVLQRGFNITESQASQCLELLPIYHVHGSFGELVGQNARPYARNFYGINEAAERLSIVSEDIESSGVLEECRQQISMSRQIVFLGFGYDRTNVERLLIPEIMLEREKNGDGAPSTIYGTTYGLVPEEISAQVAPLFQDLPLSFDDGDKDCLMYLRRLARLWS